MHESFTHNGALFCEPKLRTSGSAVILCVTEWGLYVFLFFEDCCVVHTYLVWRPRSGVGTELADNPSKKRNHTKRSGGLVNLACTLVWALEGRYGLKDCLSGERNTSLCRVEWSHGDQARSSVGIFSSRVELTSLALLPFHCLSNLISPTVSWFGCVLFCFGLLPWIVWETQL